MEQSICDHLVMEKERVRIFIINYFIFNPLYPPPQLVIELNPLCQMIVHDCDASAGYVAKIFSQINATFAGEPTAQIDGDIANHIFLAALLQNQICVAVKFITYCRNDLVSR